MFSIRPDCYFGIILSDVMVNNEAILISGARPYCTYSGYLETFK